MYSSSCQSTAKGSYPCTWWNSIACNQRRTEMYHPSSELARYSKPMGFLLVRWYHVPSFLQPVGQWSPSAGMGVYEVVAESANDLQYRFGIRPAVFVRCHILLHRRSTHTLAITGKYHNAEIRLTQQVSRSLSFRQPHFFLPNSHVLRHRNCLNKAQQLRLPLLFPNLYPSLAVAFVVRYSPRRSSDLSNFRWRRQTVCLSLHDDWLELVRLFLVLVVGLCPFPRRFGENLVRSHSSVVSICHCRTHFFSLMKVPHELVLLFQPIDSNDKTHDVWRDVDFRHDRSASMSYFALNWPSLRRSIIASHTPSVVGRLIQTQPNRVTSAFTTPTCKILRSKCHDRYISFGNVTFGNRSSDRIRGAWS